MVNIPAWQCPVHFILYLFSQYQVRTINTTLIFSNNLDVHLGPAEHGNVEAFGIIMRGLDA
jgi:hypothetical protein